MVVLDMDSLLYIFLVILVGGFVACGSQEVSFDQNYEIGWGADHVLKLNRGKEIQLSMDTFSGSGFRSKMNYASGFFHMRIKVPGRDSAGVVTAYYMTSQGNRHDELDFEFLGNREGKPYTLQTNVFTDGNGNREQRIRLWFDPTADFHNYRILWNQHQIVFYVDNIPIRVHKNKTNLGAGYPSKPMQIQASLWNGESWATNGGKEKINWTYAPFQAHFQGFDVRGCQVKGSDVKHCYSDRYGWNREQCWQLDPARQRRYDNFKRTYMAYDYCTDKGRYPTPPAECL